MPKKKSKPRSAITVDMSGVEDRKSGDIVSPGDYHLKVAKAEIRNSDAGNDYINMTVTTVKAAKSKDKGKTLYHTCSLKPNALWNLRNTMQAMGLKVPKKSITIKMAALKGKIFGATVDDGEWDGKPKSEVVDVWKVGDRTIGAKKKKSKKSKREEEDEDEEEIDDEDEDEEEDEEDEEDEDDEGDEDEDEEDEEDEEEDEDEEMEELEEL